MALHDRWQPYVPVAERRRQAQLEIGRQRKSGFTPQPVEIDGRKITRTFWGDAWCSHLESFSDFENRLPRGRTYVRNGSVCHLEIDDGIVSALVSGSSLYRVKVRVKKLPGSKWDAVKEKCSGQISSLLELLQGKFSNSVMSVVTHTSEGLFPLPREIEMDCSCPDYAYMCKHIAAVLYGVGARLDDQPELLFLLRGINHEELIQVDTVKLLGGGKQSKSKRVAESEIGDVFGIELLQKDEPDDSSLRNAAAKSAKNLKSSARKSKPTRETGTNSNVPLPAKPVAQNTERLKSSDRKSKRTPESETSSHAPLRTKSAAKSAETLKGLNTKSKPDPVPEIKPELGSGGLARAAARVAARLRAATASTQVAKDTQAASASKAVFTAKSIRELRQRFEMTRGEFAELLGVTAVTIMNWEKAVGTLGLNGPSNRALTSLCGLSKGDAWKHLRGR